MHLDQSVFTIIWDLGNLEGELCVLKLSLLHSTPYGRPLRATYIFDLLQQPKLPSTFPANCTIRSTREPRGALEQASFLQAKPQPGILFLASSTLVMVSNTGTLLTYIVVINCGSCLAVSRYLGTIADVTARTLKAVFASLTGKSSVKSNFGNASMAATRTSCISYHDQQHDHG